MDLDLGEIISIENFIVYKVEPERGAIRLALAQGENTARAYQIEVRGIDFERETYFRGEVVEKLIGTVWTSREDQLLTALQKLDPDFDITSERIPVNGMQMPNPIKFYNTLLDAIVIGSLSTIHGDLHLGNILIGPSESALLIDFARTRDGHAIFDWATLEVSLLSELIVPKIGESWDSARSLIAYLAMVDNPELESKVPRNIADSLKAIAALRQIVAQNLAAPNQWHEYSLALAFTTLRAMTWETMSQGSRRLMYLVSAVAMQHFSKREIAGDAEYTPSPDSTDFFSQ